MPDTRPVDSPKPLSTRRKIAFSLIILSVFMAMLITLGELYLRNCCIELYTKPTLLPPYDTAQKDGLLGWKMTPGYTFDGKMQNENSQEYNLSIRYDENGFKAFGDTASGRPKVLFLGDSFTASIEVSNGKSFFNLVGDSLGVEVFAYGHAGFGTLQEYLVLDQWVDRIRPDVVVWQVCSNDFIDNYAPLEIASGYKVGERRPYLADDGEIFYRRPLSLWQRLKEQLIFFKWAEERWDFVQQNLFNKEKRVGEYYISTEKRAYPLFDKSVKITENIFTNIKNRLPAGTKVLGFAADIFQPQRNELQRIFEENGFAFQPEPALNIEKAKVEEKQMVLAVDGWHWNERGHEIVAWSLLPFLESLTGRND